MTQKSDILIQDINQSTISNINAIVLATIPLTRCYYVINGVGLDNLIVLMVLMLNIFHLWRSIATARFEISFFIKILVFGFLGCFVNSSNSWFDPTLFFHNLFPLFSVFVAVIFLLPNANPKMFWNLYLGIGVVASLCCLYQQAMFVSTGSFPIDIFFPLPFEVARELETFSIFRPSAFFTEPAHLSIYLVPLFYYLLIKNKYVFVFIIGLGIIASGSTTGLILLAGILIMRFFQRSIKGVLITMLIVAVGSLLIYRYLQEAFVQNFLKLSQTQSDDVRFLGVLSSLEKFDLVNYIFGIGLNQLGNFDRTNQTANYAPAIIYILISYGVLGFNALIKYLKTLYARTKGHVVFLLIFVGILCSDQLLFNGNFVFLITCCVMSTYLTSETSDQIKQAYLS